MTVLVTGAAGFIGYHLACALLDRGDAVVGVDNLNDYYEVTLKEARLARLEQRSGFAFRRLDIADRDEIARLIAERSDIDRVVHLAAQAGVRYSLINPYAYLRSNVDGHVVLLEAVRKLPRLRHFVYASSSSVYGANTKMPFSVEDRTDRPVSLYGATKKAMEVISESYTAMFGLPLTGLRFFTVYGPWGRPDMAAFIFTRAILSGEPIPVFNHGDMGRDFTFIDDIVAGVLNCLDRPYAGEGRRPAPPGLQPGQQPARAPYRLHRDLGAGAGTKRRHRAAADPAGRRQGDLRRHRSVAPRPRLRAQGRHRRRHRPLRRVVPRILPGLTTGGCGRRPLLVEGVQRRAVALPDDVPADFQRRRHLLVVDAEGLGGNGEPPDLLDDRKGCG